MKNRVPVIAIALFSGLVVMCCCFIALRNILLGNNDIIETKSCPPLPDNFSKDYLVGTWIGRYFESTERLMVKEDGTYKQLYSNDFFNFESDWQKWYIEHDPSGYIRLHMIGMRRCDGLESECNDPGGGLPKGTLVINPCENTSMIYPDDEIILFVTGSYSDVPRGIMIQQAALAGSDWSYTFRLEEPLLP